MQISEHHCTVVPVGIFWPKVLLILGITVNALYSLRYIVYTRYTARISWPFAKRNKRSITAKNRKYESTNLTKLELPQTLLFARRV